jgi:hypothetical protein
MSTTPTLLNKPSKPSNHFLAIIADLPPAFHRYL